MRRILALMAAVLLALAAVLPVRATEPVGPVYPFHPGQYDGTTVEVGQTLLLGAHWGGCVPGLVTSFAKASILAWSIDGAPLATPATWTHAIAVTVNPHPWVPGEPDLSACVSKAATHTPYGFWASWAYPVVFSAPGDHVIRLVWTASIPGSTAATTTASAGRTGSGATGSWTPRLTIHVVAAP